MSPSAVRTTSTARNNGLQTHRVVSGQVGSPTKSPPVKVLPTAQDPELEHINGPNPSAVASSSSIPTTAVTTLGRAEDYGLVTQDVPTKPYDIVNYAFDPQNRKKEPKFIIGCLIVRLTNKRELTQEHRQWVFNILQSLSKIQPVTTDVEKMLQIKFILSALCGEWPKAKGPYAFPEPFPTAAAAMLTSVEEDLDYEEAIEASASPSPPPVALSTKKRKRKQPKANTSTSISRPAFNLSNPVIKQLMNNIAISNTAGRRGLKLANKDLKVNCNVFGANGLEVGDWWPYRICALNDGAHGATQAGIAGNANTGTFSIVVSRAYEGLDKDTGDTIVYSGSNAHDNTDPDTPILTHATKGMQLAHTKRRSIRVLRTAGSSWKGAPSVGIRYDGLYTILAEEILENHKGGAYLAFMLKRIAGQVDIDTSRPSRAEKIAFEQMKNSI